MRKGHSTSGDLYEKFDGFRTINDGIYTENHGLCTNLVLKMMYCRSRVRVSKVITELPPVKPFLLKTPKDKAEEMGAGQFLWKNPDILFRNPDFLLKNVEFTIKPVDAEGNINKMAAALSGRAWLVSLANAQTNHKDNAMAMAFDLAYYETELMEQQQNDGDGSE